MGLFSRIFGKCKKEEVKVEEKKETPKKAEEKKEEPKVEAEEETK